MFQSLPHMLFETIKRMPEKAALRIERQGFISTYSYHQFGGMIRNLAHGMASLGIKKGDKIAILSANRPEWTVADFAVFSLHAVSVPIYQTLPANQIEYILNDAEVSAIFVEDKDQYAKIKQIREQIPGLKIVISFDPIAAEEEGVHLLRRVISSGEKHRKKDRDFFLRNLESIETDEVCTIVYTSGTTGEPKGVMLTHRGFLHDIVNAEAVFGILESDVFLSFLPLSHLYERLAGHWCPMYRGATIYYARGIDKVIEDIEKAKPTVMVSVPRLYEKIATSVIEKVETSSALKRKLFYWALDTGKIYHQHKYENNLNAAIEQKYKWAEKIVFGKIKQKLGGRFRFPISGGAPLSVETLKFFESIGLQIVEGYGMTETHLIISLTPPGKTKYGSCGKPIDGVNVKISEDGEVLVEGVTVMEGYYKKPELTGEVIDGDGWLHTGDIGYLDEDGYLFLTDRKKNIIITAGGKNVAPAPVENTVKTSKYIDDVCIIGDGKKFISALVVVNLENVQQFAKSKGIKIDTLQDASADKEINELIWKEVQNLQEDFAQYEKIKKIAILPQALSLEKEEITPSLKIKRNVVEKNYSKLIDSIYSENNAD